jgi:hypothetical protein
VKSENFLTVWRDKSGNLAKLKSASNGDAANGQNTLGRCIVFFRRFAGFCPKQINVCADLYHAMTGTLHTFWDDLPDDLAEELLARAAAGEAVFCEHLAQLMAA